MPIRVEPGDVFFTRGTSMVSRLIRVFTRRRGEARTMVNHVGVVVTHGTHETAAVVEALSKVELRPLARYRGSQTRVAIYRKMDLSESERSIIKARAESYVGRDYGYVKLVAHFLDWCFGGVYVFRRLVRMDRYPICSWLVAYSFDSAGLHFGVPPGSADPDDIWDFVIHNEAWRCVHELEVLP